MNARSVRQQAAISLKYYNGWLNECR
jgi:hypothetical protein